MEYFFLFVFLQVVEIAIVVGLSIYLRNYVFAKINEREKRIKKMLGEIIGVVDIIKEYIQLLEDRSQKKINRKAGELFESQTKIISKLIKNG